MYLYLAELCIESSVFIAILFFPAQSAVYSHIYGTPSMIKSFLLLTLLVHNEVKLDYLQDICPSAETYN